MSSSSSALHDASLEAGLLAHDSMGTKDGQAGEALAESLRCLRGEPERYKDVASSVEDDARVADNDSEDIPPSL